MYGEGMRHYPAPSAVLKGRTPLIRRSYFLRLRSQMSAPIEPIRPIAASPEKASISAQQNSVSVSGYCCSHKDSNEIQILIVSPLRV